MTILLLNTNPIVHKLVSLSAQKTGDTLYAIGSLYESMASDYDLFIVDDGRYSDDMMLGCSFTYRKSLFMAMRGQIVPGWFDYVVYKPFLPTDLVDMLLTIQHSLPCDEIDYAINNPAMVLDHSDLEELQGLLQEEELFFGDEGLDDAEELNVSVFDPFEGIERYDELDALSEEELRRAIGESAEGSQGIEVLQALLKALSSDEVAKTLKKLDINININFGNAI